MIILRVIERYKADLKSNKKKQTVQKLVAKFKAYWGGTYLDALGQGKVPRVLLCRLPLLGKTVEV